MAALLKSSALVSDLDLPALYAPLLFGTVAASAIAGNFWHQAFQYFTEFREDRLFHKLIVAGLMAVSLLSFSVNIAICYRAFIVDVGLLLKNPVALLLAKAPSYFDVVAAAPGAAALLSQIFFIDRAFRISERNRVLVVGLLVLCFAHGTMWLTVTIMGALTKFRPGADGSLSGTLEHVSAASLWTSAVADVAVSSILVWLLSRSKEGFNPQTDSLLQHFARMSLVTGSISAFAATVTAIVLVASAGTARGFTAYAAFTLPLPQVFASVVCGTLDHRLKAQRRQGSATGATGSFGIKQSSSSGASTTRKHARVASDPSYHHSTYSSGTGGSSPVSPRSTRFAPWTIPRQPPPKEEEVMTIAMSPRGVLAPLQGRVRHARSADAAALRARPGDPSSMV